MSAMRVDAKVVMLGKESVGKTSLVERYVHHRFLVGPYQNTIGAAFVAKPIQVGEKVITLGIWDTAGSERYEAMSRIYYRGARAALVCYEIGALLFETSSKTGNNVAEETGVDLGQKKDSYFYSCCHNN
ncbi:Ras-related protein Rab-24 [Liparis tanakae]|uniref:Ras-related protein Rab-24 n=1 Tax=Liparis tanakae TaxID=230148 RepID=A0A4Z2FM76_9TELE|nr:Ras-related protein Rab-24 [Liparis tanakae]